MGTKTISIMDDVHKLLILNRIKDESFSEIIRRNLDKKRNIMKFAGALSNLSDSDVKSIKENIKSLRAKSTKEVLNDMSGF